MAAEDYLDIYDLYDPNFWSIRKELEMTFKYEETLCPDCGGQMVSRNGKYGIFWGCKKFPDCKGTRDSQGRSKEDRAKEKGEEYEEDKKDEVNKFSFKRTK